MRRGFDWGVLLMLTLVVLGIVVCWKYGVMYEKPAPTETVVVEILDVAP